MPTSKIAALRFPSGVLVAAAYLLGCNSNIVVPQIDLLGRTEALELGRTAAIASGYDLSGYQLATSRDELNKDTLEWTFHYVCKPLPPHPGCEFLVVVDRRTGKTKIHRGQ